MHCTFKTTNRGSCQNITLFAPMCRLNRFSCGRVEKIKPACTLARQNLLLPAVFGFCNATVLRSGARSLRTDFQKHWLTIGKPKSDTGVQNWKPLQKTLHTARQLLVESSAIKSTNDKLLLFCDSFDDKNTIYNIYIIIQTLVLALHGYGQM